MGKNLMRNLINKNVIPNLFTFANLSFGMLSIMFTFTENKKLAVIMILSAAFVDRYDGKIARMISAESPIGKELDSLADLVSFGAAPAILSWVVFLQPYRLLGYLITILFPIAGAFRLARFNIAKTKNMFSGVPITIAGSVLALDILVTLLYIPHNIVSVFLMILLSYLMISNIKIKKF